MCDPGPLGLVRLWLAEQGGLRSLAPTILVVALIAGALALFFPLSASPETGVVTSFGTTQTEEGSYPVAVVRWRGREISVPLPRGHTCLAGSPIRLLLYRRLWGDRLGANALPCRSPAYLTGS